MNFIESLLAKIPDLNYTPFFNKFWDDITFEFILKLIIIYFFIVWIAIVVWVIKDIWNRTDSIIFQTLCILIVLILTPLWVFLYILIRPSKTLFEKYYEEIEENLDTLSNIIKWKVENEEKILYCPECNQEINEDFSFCPSCESKIKTNCISCNKEIRVWWKICPYCWEEQNKEDKKNNDENEDINNNLEKDFSSEESKDNNKRENKKKDKNDNENISILDDDSLLKEIWENNV